MIKPGTIYELEVIYLNELNTPISKKSVQYEGYELASHIYHKTIETLTSRGGGHMVILRQLDASGVPIMIVNEKVGVECSGNKKAP